MTRIWTISPGKRSSRDTQQKALEAAMELVDESKGTMVLRSIGVDQFIVSHQVDDSGMRAIPDTLKKHYIVQTLPD